MRYVSPLHWWTTSLRHPRHRPVHGNNQGNALMGFPGTEFFHDRKLGLFARLYCAALGIPIVGLRIRLRRVKQLLPGQANHILDAGCGRGVIARTLATRYPGAHVDAVDMDEGAQHTNKLLAEKMGLGNIEFKVADVTQYQAADTYDLIVSVDNLEHVKDDHAVIRRFHASMKTGGVLVIHVPHYYRRWPLFKWTQNFDVPGHVRPGYHLPELIERVRTAGFTVQRHGFSFGFLENLINNLSYAITGAREERKILYALLFPILNVLAWLGQWSRPAMGAGAWVVASRDQTSAAPEEPDDAGEQLS